MTARRWILGIAVLVCASTAQAGMDHSCGYSIAYDIRLAADGVTLERSREQYRLEGDRIHRNGGELALPPEQRALAAEYRAGIEALVPAVTQLAAGAAMLGFESLALTAALLSGEEHELTRATERIEIFALQLGRALDSRHLPAGERLALSDFDTELGDLAGTAAADLSASLLSTLGRALQSPPGSTERSERLGALIERRIEARAQALEVEIDRLCERMRTLDALEARLGLFDVLRSGARAPTHTSGTSRLRDV